MKIDHVYRKFSDNIESIKKLWQKDTNFRETCDNFEEMSTWLAEYCGSKGRPSEECDHAREVIRDLEHEINQALRDAGY